MQDKELANNRWMRARVMSSAIRTYFPEVLLGFYTDLEMVDADKDPNGSGYTAKLDENGEITVVEDADIISEQ